MTRVTCAISGIKFEVSYFPALNIPHTEGYIHPIFAVPYHHLHNLYTRHTKGELTSNESYLLFMSFLHSSDKITWKCPATCNPNEARTKKLVENNLSQLIIVLEKSACIKYPGFKQPRFKVTVENSSLEQIPNWIKAWESNIKNFQTSRFAIAEREDLQKVENRLSYLILSGEKPERYAFVIADWADRAAEFPLDKVELWKKTIRSSFSDTKMFNTPLATLREIKEYCECNIEAGSIHFHSLMNVIREGVNRHVNYLGGSSLGFTLITTSDAGRTESEIRNAVQVASLLAKAPEAKPVESDYGSSLEFLQAKLAYRVATTVAITKSREKRYD